MSTFHKILVANRGEIACRVMRTARALGYRSVAVYSDPDAGAPHVRSGDEAVALGGRTAAESYLNIPALLEAARRTGADAVHPGYGFLSERADFARACAAAGLVFIGPPAEAIEVMGDKAGAKRRMLAAGVPCVPGYLGDDPSDAAFARAMRDLGLPLLVKAVAGGGGRGMRLVRDAGELDAALAGARREAESAFGDGRLMLERLVEDGRHIEIQVFADAQGAAIHLGERDCSAQRRRQKVIEETPSPSVGPELRAAMGRDAVAAARAVDYRGAGTVEFIVDAAGRHYFLEMNTRLQVEHPVTECVTGLDLVEWQLRVAAGEPLPLQQGEVRFSGHAIEARLYAEDPYEGFAPQTGRILHWRPESSHRTPGLASLRVDDGIEEGGIVSPYYDAMLAKLIVHGRDRDDARRRLAAALEAMPLLGLRTNGRYLRDLVRHPDFAAARITTRTLDDWCASGADMHRRPEAGDDDWALAAAWFAAPPQEAGLRCASGPRSAAVASWSGGLERDGVARSFRIELVPEGIQVSSGEQRWHVVIEPAGRDGWRWACVNGVRSRRLLRQFGDALYLARDAAVHVFREPSPAPAPDAAETARQARAPVAGVVAQLAVSPGDRVARGQPLVCVEAMKMEMWLQAAAPGTVRAVPVALRDTVAAGAVLVELEPDAP